MHFFSGKIDNIDSRSYFKIGNGKFQRSQSANNDQWSSILTHGNCIPSIVRSADEFENTQNSIDDAIISVVEKNKRTIIIIIKYSKVSWRTDPNLIILWNTESIEILYIYVKHFQAPFCGWHPRTVYTSARSIGFSFWTFSFLQLMRLLYSHMIEMTRSGCTF